MLSRSLAKRFGAVLAGGKYKMVVVSAFFARD